MAKSFGSWLRAARKALGLTQRHVADQLRVTSSYVTLIEKGRTNAPTVKRCRQIARVLGLDEREVIRRALHECTPALRNYMGTAVPGVLPGDESVVLVPVFRLGPKDDVTFDESGRPTGELLRHMPCDIPDDPNLFACEVPDSSMTGAKGGFEPGDVVIFSPAAEVKGGDCAFVTTDELTTFRQIRFSGERIRLCPLNRSLKDRTVKRTSNLHIARLVRRIQSF